MRIFLDIGHPAHVHYFRNFIKIMQSRGHQFLITARDKDVTHALLKAYNIDFISRGKGSKGTLGKASYLFKADIKLLKLARKYNPDLFLSFASSYAAHVAWLLGKPHVAFDDTEHAKLEHLLYIPFTNVLCTPDSFQKDFGKKHIRFNGNMELCYLHPNYFIPDQSVLDFLNVKENEKYVLMRFVSWNASHDVGHKGITRDMKRKAVKEFSKYAKVFISSEAQLPKDLEKFKIKIPPNKIHDAIYFSFLYFGESGTMASESAILGTTAINIATSALFIGVFKDIAKYNLMHIIPDENKAFEKALELIKLDSLKKQSIKYRNQLLLNKIDVTAFMVWFVENYPESVRIMKDNPIYQNKFA